MPDTVSPSPAPPAQPKSKKGLWVGLGSCLGCLGLILIAIVIFVAISASSLRWKEYNYPLGKFQISFPKNPTTESSTQNVEGSTITLTQYTSEDGSTAYLVQFANLPDNIDLKDTNKLLDAALKGEAESKSGSKIASSSLTTLAGYPAQDYVIQLSDGTYVKGRNVLVNKTLYSLLVGSKDQNPRNYQKFIDSFKLQ